MRRDLTGTKILFLFTGCAMLLAGCQGIAFSPEMAVQQEIMQGPMKNFQVDPNTYNLLQKIDLDDGYIVLVSFQGNRLNTGRESCLFMYETFRILGGWAAGSGSGGCTTEQPDPDERAISVGVHRSSGRDRNDPGTSVINGQIYLDEITSVKITWADEMVQDASIANQSYIAVRQGSLDFKKIEALDTQGNILFTENWAGVAPGKN